MKKIIRMSDLVSTIDIRSQVKSILLKLTIITVFMISLICAPNSIWASQYSYSTVLPPGWSWSYVHGINDDGDLVGYGGVDSTTKSFIYSNGTFTELLPPGWLSAYALTINSSGSIVGYGTVSGTDKAFLYIDGAYTELLPPDWAWAWGIRLNDNGDVVGGGADGAYGGFLYSNGSYTEILPPGWLWATSYGINNSGIIAGWGADGLGVEKGYIYNNGSYTELLPPGWISATAYNINENGEVIGEGTDSDGKEKGYLYSNGEYIELLPPDWSDVVPEDINDNGVVAGYGTEGTVVKGFVYTNGTYLIFTSPVRPNTKIIGINNSKEVVGLAYNSSRRGFVSSLCPDLPARILSITPTYYSTLQEAYDNAVDEDIIQAHDIIFTGGLLFDFHKSVTIAGGFDCDYSVVNGASRLIGDMVINSGTATIENIVLE